MLLLPHQSNLSDWETNHISISFSLWNKHTHAHEHIHVHTGTFMNVWMHKSKRCGTPVRILLLRFFGPWLNWFDTSKRSRFAELTLLSLCGEFPNGNHSLRETSACALRPFWAWLSCVNQRLDISLNNQNHPGQNMAVNLSKNGSELMAAYSEVVDCRSNTNWWEETSWESGRQSLYTLQHKYPKYI